MKEKKLIVSVVLGVSFVSLVTAIIAGIAESLMILIDMVGVSGVLNVEYANYSGAFTLTNVLVGAALVVIFLVNRKYRFGVNLGLAIGTVAWYILSVILMRVLIPYVRGKMVESTYPIFASFLTVAITLIVCTALMFVAWFYLMYLKKKEESVQTVPAPETDKGIEQAK